jgi:hypothetical protein
MFLSRERQHDDANVHALKELVLSVTEEKTELLQDMHEVYIYIYINTHVSISRR